jgi:ATP-dependent RNA helicase DeaD
MYRRRGHVTKKDIGSIRIFDRETKFEIARDAVDRFSAAIKATLDEPIRIEAAGAPGARKERTEEGKPDQGSRPPKPFKPRPKGKKSNDGRR